MIGKHELAALLDVTLPPPYETNGHVAGHTRGGRAPPRIPHRSTWPTTRP